MFSQIIYILPELFFCFFTLSLIVHEYLISSSYLEYKKYLDLTITSLFVIVLLYLFQYQFLFYFSNVVQLNINNFFISESSVILKLVLSILLIILLFIKKIKLDFSQTTITNSTTLKRYLIVFCLSYLSLLLLPMAFNFITFITCIELLGLSCVILIMEPEVNQVAKPNILLSSSLSYYIIHVFGSIFLLLSIIFIYISTGSLNFFKLSIIISEIYQDCGINHLLNLGLFFFFVGLVIKTGVAPFYFWLLRAYSQLSMFNLAYFLIIVKVMVLFVIHQFVLLFPGFTYYFNELFLTIAIINLILGPLVTIVQFTIKKFLIGSSITNVGYMFLSFSTPSQTLDSFNFLIFIIVYLLAMIGLLIIESFLFLNSFYLENDINRVDFLLLDLKCLPSNIKLQLVFFMLCLMGFPPSMNFFVKLKILITLFPINSFYSFLAFFFSILAMLYYLSIILEIVVNFNYTSKHLLNSFVGFFNLRLFYTLYGFILTFCFFYLLALTVFVLTKIENLFQLFI